MPRILVAITIGGCLWSATPLQAGLYNLAEPARGPGAKGKIAALPFGPFEREFSDLLSIGVEPPPNQPKPEKKPLREHYQDKQAELEKKNRAGALTVDESINLSEYLIRLRQYDAAMTLLGRLAREERNNFMVHANLATAYQLTGQLPQAIDALEQVKSTWPRAWNVWSDQQLQWYKRVETYQAKLVRLRFAESKRASGKLDVANLGVDDLFGVHFVGESGQYEAGKLAADQRRKLPPDALAVVQQLLLWMPEDTRLYWLLGELLNVQGDLKMADQVFYQCSWGRRYAANQLREHWQIVKEARAKAGPPAGEGADFQVNGIGNTEPASTPSPDQSASWLPDWPKLIIVGSLAGLVVAALAYLQFREIRRRRGKSIASKGC